MKVEAMMNRNVITISKHSSIEEGKERMKQHRIRHLPVVDDDGTLNGIVSDRDLLEWKDNLNERDSHSTSIESVMTKNVITAHPREFIEDLSAIFYDERVGCIPVVDEGQVVGVITERDMLYTLIQLTGAHQPSTQFEVKVENVAGKLADVTACIKEHQVNITSVLVYPGDNELSKVLVLRVQTMNPQAILQSLKSEGYKVLWPEAPGGSL